MKNGTKHGRAAAAVLLALALLPAARASAAQVCGCDKRQGLSWAEHLQYYSNMVSIVKDVNDRYDELKKFHENAETGWTAVSEALDKAEKLKSRSGQLKLDGSALKSQFQTYRDDPEALEGLLDKYTAFRTDWSDTSTALQNQNDGEGWEASLREAEKAREDFVKTAKRFLSAYQKAENLRYGSGGNIDCVVRLFDEADRKKETSDSWAQDLLDGQNAAADNRSKLLGLKNDVESNLNDLDGYRRSIAETFGLAPTATLDQIETEIHDRTTPRVTLRFGKVKNPIDEQRLRKGIDKPEKVEPVGDSDGPGFLGWRERSGNRDFTDWDTPLEEDTTLDAKWGYRIHVSGEEHVFPVLGFNARLSLSDIFADPWMRQKRQQAQENTPDGKVFDGWVTNERPEEPIMNLTSLAEDGMRLTAHYKDVEYTLTFVVPDGTKTPPPQKLGFKEIPSVPPYSELQSANGFRYVRWALKNGETWNGGQPLTEDLTVYAVPEADFKLNFYTKDNLFIGTVPVRSTDSFSLDRAPTPPKRKGETFEGWIDNRENEFKGGTVEADMNLYAAYHPETSSELVRRLFKPLEDRFPVESLAVADIGLLLLLGGLVVVGIKPRAKKRGAKQDAGNADKAAAEPAEDNGNPAS